MDESKSHADLSKVYRASNDQSRRNSYAGGSSSSHATTSNQAIANDRTRHWMTIMGATSMADSSSNAHHSSSATNPRVDVNRNSLSSNLPHSRVNMLPTTRIPNIPPDNAPDQPPRTQRRPIKPFQCDKCTRRFERRGHLKVSTTNTPLLTFLHSSYSETRKPGLTLKYHVLLLCISLDQFIDLKVTCRCRTRAPNTVHVPIQRMSSDV